MKRYAAMVRDANGNEMFFAETVGECQKWCVENGITGEHDEYIAEGTFDEDNRSFEMEDMTDINNSAWIAENTKEDNTMNNTITFEYDRQTYEMTANGRFYCTPLGGKKTRIGKLAFETVYNAYMAKRVAYPETEESTDKKEDTTEKPAEKVDKPKTAKAKKPRARKMQEGSMEFSHEGMKVILTPKQVDFIKHLPDTCFWEDGVQSQIWIDCLCDEIGGQFAAKPMTVGAMISTLCEKGLGLRSTDRKNNRKCVSFQLTELGQKIATELGI